jgi:hypothetical protein
MGVVAGTTCLHVPLQYNEKPILVYIPVTSSSRLMAVVCAWLGSDSKQVERTVLDGSL